MSTRKRKSESDAGDEEYAVNGIIGFNVDLDGSYWYEVEWAPPKNDRKWPEGNATWQEESILKADGLEWAIKEFLACLKKNGKTKEAEIARLLAVNETVIAQQNELNMAAGSSRMKAKIAKPGLKQAKSLAMPELDRLAVNLDLESHLEGEIFGECKDSFRPVKNKLRLLKSDRNSAEFTAALIEIGHRVGECLKVKQDSDQLGDWHSYLWLFAALFTKLNGKELHELYKIHTKSPDKNQDPGISKITDEETESGVLLESGLEEEDKPLESLKQKIKKRKQNQKLEMASDSGEDCIFLGDLGKIGPQELAELKERKRKKQQAKKKVKPTRQKKQPSPDYQASNNRRGRSRTRKLRNQEIEVAPSPACAAESYPAVRRSPVSKSERTKTLLEAVEHKQQTPIKQKASTKPTRSKSLPGLVDRLKRRLPRASTSKAAPRRINPVTLGDLLFGTDWLARRQLDFGGVGESPAETARELETVVLQQQSKDKQATLADWEADKHKLDSYGLATGRKQQRQRTISVCAGFNELRCVERSRSSTGLPSAAKSARKDQPSLPNRGAIFLPQFRCVPGGAGEQQHCAVCDKSFSSRSGLFHHAGTEAHRRCENSQMRGLKVAARHFNLPINIPANFDDGSAFAREAQNKGEYILESQATQLINSIAIDNRQIESNNSIRSLGAATPDTSTDGINPSPLLWCDLGVTSNGEMHKGMFTLKRDVMEPRYEIQEIPTADCDASGSNTVKSYTVLQPPSVPFRTNLAMFPRQSSATVLPVEPGLIGGFQSLFDQHALPNISAGFDGSETFNPFLSLSTYCMTNGTVNSFATSSSVDVAELSRQPHDSQMTNRQASSQPQYGPDDVLINDAEEWQQLLAALQGANENPVDEQQTATPVDGLDFPATSPYASANESHDHSTVVEPGLIDVISQGLQVTAESGDANAPIPEVVDFLNGSYNQSEMGWAGFCDLNI